MEKTIKISVGDYIFKRVSELTKTVFGVPGDYTLPLLEHIYNFEEKAIKWRGNNNELNAGYCADGYARVNKFGCLISTFAVGDLSALNAIGGAFAEHVSLLHIVGTSSTFLKDNKKTVDLFSNIHHLVPNKKTYAPQDHHLYEKIAENFSCCVETLTLDDVHTNTIQTKVDHVLEQIIYHMKPGYLYVPKDLPDMEFQMSPSKKLNLNLDKNHELSFQENEIVNFLLEETYKSKNPGFVGDLFLRNDKPKVMDLLEKTNWYCYSTYSARGAVVDETLPNFQGVFTNEYSTKNTLKIMESNDLIMHWGSNLNENSFIIASHCNDEWLSSANIIFLGKDYVQIGYGDNAKAYIDDVNCSRIFNSYLEKLDLNKISKIQTRSEQKGLPLTVWSDTYDVDISSNTDDPLNQVGLSKFLSTKGFFKEGDIVVNELSSFLFEMGNIKLPKNGRTINQGFNSSIGYGLPAALGVCIALQDLNLAEKNRVILIQGDGAAQMTLQDLNCYLTYNTHPIIFLLNNAGYTIERELEGRTRAYNDFIGDWNWTGMLKVFGDPNEVRHHASKITNFKDLNDRHKNIMENKEFDKKVKFFECMLDKSDIVPTFKKMLQKEPSRD